MANSLLWNSKKIALKTPYFLLALMCLLCQYMECLSLLLFVYMLLRERGGDLNE